MVHQAVEVGGAELPVAEGAPVNASSKVSIVMAGLQPPKDVTSLGVEGLVVAIDVTALHLSCSTKDRVKKHGVNCNDNRTGSEQKIMHDNMGTQKRGSLSYIGHTYIQDLSQ
jgi:hypothetical protein